MVKRVCFCLFLNACGSPTVPPPDADDADETDCNAYTCTTGDCMIFQCRVEATAGSPARVNFQYSSGEWAGLPPLQVEVSRDPNTFSGAWTDVPDERRGDDPRFGWYADIGPLDVGLWYLRFRQRDLDHPEEDWYDCFVGGNGRPSNYAPVCAPDAPGFDRTAMMVVEVVAP